MRVDALDYALPPELIAQRPLAERDGARLLVLPSSGTVVDRRVVDLPELLTPGSLLVVNDTRVLPARVLGKKASGGKAEILLVRRLDDVEVGAPRGFERWTALGKASKGLPPGTVVTARGMEIVVEGRGDDGLLRVTATTSDGRTVREALAESGTLPIPPYMKRDPDASDDERYQTVFAAQEGALAAPTAGLHLSEALLQRLRERAIRVASVTLHVGLGTFRPVTAADLDEHDMHAEELSVTAETCDAIEDARARGAPVVAVGTTVVRALEAAADQEKEGRARPLQGETRLLIQPGYRFRIVDRLVTNFHLPRSTLLALVGAFAGLERTLDAYRHAVAQRYRFFSYGDAMLIDRCAPPTPLAGSAR